MKFHSTNQKRERKLARIVRGASIDYRVKDPYVNARLYTVIDGTVRVGLGFAKKRPSDKWNPEFGKGIAVRRAAMDIQQQIRGELCEQFTK